MEITFDSFCYSVISINVIGTSQVCWSVSFAIPVKDTYANSSNFYEKLKEILRLKYGVGLSHRQIGRSLAISPSVVSRYANRAAQLGIKQWPLPTGWDDTKLKHAFLQTQVKMKKHSLPDWATVHRELRNKCVTLQLLWEEYCERNPGGFYSYNHYCRMYREWLKTTSPSMRQVHKAGEKLFVDYCGPTVGVTDPETGEIRTAQVIVAVLGASSYTWAEATWSQQLEDWVMSHVRCFQWLVRSWTCCSGQSEKRHIRGHVSMILIVNPTYRADAWAL